ncbi:MAG: hypothetical protein QMB94_08010 [Phycisphaerales bacterium]
MKAISSLSCWDIVLALMDGRSRTAAEIGAITGRTPGALHLPLDRLQEAQKIEHRIRPIEGKGRPSREYIINPNASEKPCSNGKTYEEAIQKATSAGLRLMMRNSARLAEENTRRFEEDIEPRTSARWIQFSNLLPQDIEWVEKQLMHIMDRLAQGRTNAKGQRYRVALMMVPDEFDD